MNLLGFTKMSKQNMLLQTHMNMLKSDNDNQTLTEYCIIKCTLHAAITALGYGLWP